MLSRIAQVILDGSETTIIDVTQSKSCKVLAADCKERVRNQLLLYVVIRMFAELGTKFSPEPVGTTEPDPVVVNTIEALPFDESLTFN